MKQVFLAILILGLILAFYFNCVRQPNYYREARFMMGTVVEVVVPNKRAVEIVFNKFAALENLLSTTKSDSEISLLNIRGYLRVSPDTLEVVKLAKEFYELTDGNFDITVLPLLELWGLKGGEKLEKAPTQQEIDAVLPLIGSDKILIDEENATVSFTQKGMKIDLGGIAKGYVVDEAVKELRKLGINSALICAGGDIFCLGRKGSKPWLVGVKDPVHMGIAKEFSLENKAISTSGDYERYVAIGDEKYPHLINPRTGYSVLGDAHSVTVIADNCTKTDAVATALFVAGQDKRDYLSKKTNIEDFFVIK